MEPESSLLFHQRGELSRKSIKEDITLGKNVKIFTKVVEYGLGLSGLR